MTETVRSASQRKADTVARLENDADVWVATASAGRSHLTKMRRHVCLIATPTSMQAWNSLAEIDGRTIMRNGQWAAA
jgi:hypothetical protein